jgi:4a-hydroxytetrahydrobiopterin dehydratase
MQLIPLTPASRRLDRAEAGVRLQGLPGWALEGGDDALQLVRDYSTPHFLAAMELANRVSQLAEAHNHHPQLTIRWGGLRVAWTTHTLHGLHENDFLMAAATDAAIAGG